MRSKASLGLWLIALLALVPLILVAYSGFFSRMKIDDYCVIASAKQYGAWGTMAHYFNSWSGSYTRFFLFGALAPLDHLAPAFAPMMIVVSWLLSLSWFIYEVTGLLELKVPRLATSIAVSALTVFATIIAFPSSRSITWYVANTAYALPLAALTAYLALVVTTLRKRTQSRTRLVAGGIICFLAAGLAEAFTVFQFTLLPIFLLLTWLSFSGATRRQVFTALFVGWVATFASLIMQLLSPGVAARNAAIALDEVVRPVGSLSDLVSLSIDVTFGYLASPDINAGFWLLAGVGVLVALVNYCGVDLSIKAYPLRLGRAALIWNIVFQLCCAPILWAYTSDAPQFFGRFSARYFPFIAVNVAAIALCLLLLWQRDRFNALLSKRRPSSWKALGVLFLFACSLLALEIMAVRIFVWLYLLTTFVLLLTCVLWESESSFAITTPLRAGRILLICLAVAWICQASIVTTLLFVRGAPYTRTMTPGPYLLICSGLIWGYCLGRLAKHLMGSSRKLQLVEQTIKPVFFILVVVVAGNMFLGQVAGVGEVQSYAEQWDRNHAKIIALLDSGQTPIKVDSLPKGFGAYMSTYDAECYYGVPVEVVDSS